MAGYNKDSYESVKQRKARFYAANPDGRIVVELINQDVEEKAIVKTSIFLNKMDQEDKLPRAVGYALEIRDRELSVANSGKKFESVNFTSWLENCEESSIGRALDNAGFGSFQGPSMEEIEKANRLNKQYAAAKEPQFPGDDITLPIEIRRENYTKYHATLKAKQPPHGVV